MICWNEYVNPVADLCLTNQIYSVLLNAFEFKEITEVQNARLKMLLEDDEMQPRSYKYPTPLARLLKYYPRPPCVPSFVKSRMLRPLQTYFFLFQQIFFILVCKHVGNPRVPSQVLASGPKPCGANYQPFDKSINL